MLCGCSIDKEYDKFMTDFCDTFLSVGVDINIENTYGSIEKLQSKKNEDNIQKMGKLLSDMSDKIPKSRKHHYSELQVLYDGIVFLKGTYSNWDDLSLDNKSRINVEMGNIDYYYKMYKDYKTSK